VSSQSTGPSDPGDRHDLYQGPRSWIPGPRVSARLPSRYIRLSISGGPGEGRRRASARRGRMFNLAMPTAIAALAGFLVVTATWGANGPDATPAVRSGLMSSSQSGALPEAVAARSVAAAPSAVLPQLTGTMCPDVMVMAVRGSGEEPQNDWSEPSAYPKTKDGDRGAGAEGYDVFVDLTHADTRLTFSLDPITYPADQIWDLIKGYAAYQASVHSGTESLLADMQLIDSACGGTVRYVLVGYSQGAWVVHDALHGMTTAQLGEIAGVVLFGDSDFVPGQPIVKDYKTLDFNFGASAPIDTSNTGVPPSVVSRTGSWCFPIDPVCQVLPSKKLWLAEVTACAESALLAVDSRYSPCAHFHYPGSVTSKAAAFLKPFLPKHAAAPRLMLSVPPDGTIGTPYAWTAAASCGSSCTWQADPSQVPPGLGFSAAGILSGTPTNTGTYTVGLTVTGPSGLRATGKVTVTINASGSGDRTWTEVSASLMTTCAIRSDRTLWCWGEGEALGTGSQAEQPTPIQIGAAADWAHVSTDGDHTCAIRTDGTLWCWGNNQDGELGTGGPTDVLVLSPAQIGIGTDWTAVSTGGADTCAIHAKGTLWCWGGGGMGALGTGSYTNELTPVQIGSATDWASVSTGGGDTCAIRAGGSLWCWGANDYGQLGTGSTNDEFEPSPVQIGTASGWATVSASTYHNCATRTDGTLWCWGDPMDGDLGTGDTTELAPAQVGTADNWSTATAESAATCAIRTDHSLWCWGANEAGQLGTGDATDQSTPDQAGTAMSWTAVSGHDNTFCGIQADGSLWCWGEGGDGALGTGDAANRLFPVKVG
jgi:alpha-tubulin suppressor-like RCC1 family protein